MGIGLTTLGRYELGTNDVPMGIAEQMAKLYGIPFDAIRAAAAETSAKTKDEVRL
jgi:hypothetical protein